MHRPRSVSGADNEVRTARHALPRTSEGLINHLHQTEPRSNRVWLGAAEVVVSATVWCFHPVQCTCPGHSQRTDLRPEEKKKKKKRKEKETRCDEENPSQQQLEYWQQHMQNVSSWARGAIISDRQTNTWHWFDLSICRPEREATGGLKKEP